MSNQSTQTQLPANTRKVVDLAAHDNDKAERAARRQKNKKTLMRCLDPEAAQRFEIKKPTFEFSVECTYMQPQEKGGLRQVTVKDQIVAQNENDAWAMFCDKHGITIGRSSAIDLKINQLKQRTADGID